MLHGCTAARCSRKLARSSAATLPKLPQMQERVEATEISVVSSPEPEQDERVCGSSCAMAKA